MTLFKTLKKHRQPYKGFFLFYLAAIFVVSVSGVIVARLTGDMGQAAIDFDTGTLLRFLGIVSALTLLRAICSAASALLLRRFSAKAGYRFRDNFVKFFLQRPFALLDGKSGETLSVYSNDLPASVELVSDGGLRMLGDIISILVTFAYMLTLNPALTLIFFALFPVLIAVQVLCSMPIQKFTKKRFEEQANVNAIVNDSLQNTAAIASYSLESAMEARFLNAYADYIVAVKKHALTFLFLIITGIAATMAPQMIVSAVAAYNVINGSMIVAEFVAFSTLAGLAGGWLSMLSQDLNLVQGAAAGAKRLNSHLDGELEDVMKGSVLAAKGDIAASAENISFSYEKDAPKALDGVNFKIKKGERVAFVGSSGSGKSTVLKLMLGLHTPENGRINIFGADISGLSKASLQSAFAYVPQDSFLFNETIAENITGESGITDKARLEEACKNAGVLDFIKSLPEGFNAVLSESAGNISGGQKQRIALARAFYKDAPIILFDEATSALDPITEAAIFNSLCAYATDRTVIMVAHRPKSIEFCDKIIVMDGGAAVAAGTHSELLAESPAYARLYEARQEEVSLSSAVVKNL